MVIEAFGTSPLTGTIDQRFISQAPDILPPDSKNSITSLLSRALHPMRGQILNSLLGGHCSSEQITSVFNELANLASLPYSQPLVVRLEPYQLHQQKLTDIFVTFLHLPVVTGRALLLSPIKPPYWYQQCERTVCCAVCIVEGMESLLRSKFFGKGCISEASVQ